MVIGLSLAVVWRQKMICFEEDIMTDNYLNDILQQILLGLQKIKEAVITLESRFRYNELEKRLASLEKKIA